MPWLGSESRRSVCAQGMDAKFDALVRHVPLTEIPTALVDLGCWFLMARVVYDFLGPETRGKSLEQIDRELAAAD